MSTAFEKFFQENFLKTLNCTIQTLCVIFVLLKWAICAMLFAFARR